MRRAIRIFTGLAVVGLAGWKLLPLVHRLPSTETETKKSDLAPQPNPERYRALCAEVERGRIDLATRYKKARTEKERTAIEAEARSFLETTLPAMMRCWLGTPWDFNGTTPNPGEGKIACGYFVATILKDAGFRVDRYRLAQQASENIMKSFIDGKSCRRTVGQDYDSFSANVHQGEPGISIVGLDSHVAFLVNGSDDFNMIHSSGARPWCVVDEPSARAEVLKRSNYRVVGHLTSDRGVLRRWLSGEAITVRGATS